MLSTETPLEGCIVIQPKSFEDERGIFFEAYRKEHFNRIAGKQVNFIQDNLSISKKGVLRGLHFQKGSNSQAKMVQVVKGEVLDVVVDMRPTSKTFGQYFKLRLSSQNKKIIFIPKGMAHGFLTLSNEAIFSYKCDNYYNMVSESGIFYADEQLDIDWEYPINKMILSEKDKRLPTLKELYP